MSRAWIVAVCYVIASVAKGADVAGIHWQPWSDKLFEQAKAEHKLVLLDLGAVWCHWCHVMDENTYSDPAVIKLLGSHYIAVRVDQDERPDLSSRYEDYGWPATIIFNTDGSELAKRQGYLPPKPMASLLQAIIDDPTPGPSVQPETEIRSSDANALSPVQVKLAKDLFVKAYDTIHGGWGEVHHYLDWNALEYCLVEACAGDREMGKRARQTLTSGLKLVDPVWGGVYQYSTDGDWDHPHFEKIMPFQAENMRLFALAASTWNEPKWLEPAQKIRGYLKSFLTSPEGAFYTSQDADVVQGEHGGGYFAMDDAGRRKKGIPVVDKHVYARENGLAITGLVALYAASGDESCLMDARKAAAWVIANRALRDGGFRHGEKDAAGPYLADTLAMGRAFMALYSATAERAWLQHAIEAADFVEKTFHLPLGFGTSAGMTPFKPKAQVDENVMLARFTILLHHHTGSDKYKAMAFHIMQYLAAPAVIEAQGYGTAGVLLADRDTRLEPAHLTLVGPKDSPAAQMLFQAMISHAPDSARIEWLDRREGPLPRADVEYPELPLASVFVCSNGVCSQPLQTVEKVISRLTALAAKTSP